MGKTDRIKMEFLKLKLREKKIRKPTRNNVMEILGVSYPQAYNYLRELKK